jgi:hypothetical protein
LSNYLCEQAVRLERFVAQQGRQTPSPPEAKNGNGTLRRDPATEARDEWIYPQVMAGIAYAKIITRLGKKPKTWARIETENGIRKAALAYANRHGLPPPPKRKAGRPANGNTN